MPVSNSKPADFDRYWDENDQRLAAMPPAPQLEPLPIRSNEHSDVYTLRITSFGPYRVFGYYSVPKGAGPHPGLLLTPGYGSVKAVPDYNDRKRYVTLQIMHRGQRLADQPYAATYPGLLTDRIDDPERYIFRDIVADCLRGAEFLLARPEVDASRVAVSGNDLALIVAARRSGFAVAQAADLMFCRAMEARLRTEAYPLEEINDYLRAHPEREAAVARTLAYLDPTHHVERVKVTTQLSAGDQGSMAGAGWMAQMIGQFGGPLEQYQLTHEGGTDHDAVDAWLAQKLGAQPMSRFITAFD
ncbi:MAG TPA: acetylxylan esterase [Thermomicrobiales bacterium]|nr:acetylxylan esterase [Thermomicrobiales bacterium]